MLLLLSAKRIPPQSYFFCRSFRKKNNVKKSFKKWWFSFGQNQYALVHLDADLYNPQLSGLEYFYTRTSKGGLIIIHDCINEYFGSRAALDEFFLDKPETPIVIPDKSGSAIVVKQ